MRVAQVLLAMLFLGFATLQFNDPDAIQWIIVYVLVAANCASGAAGKSSIVASLVLTVVLTTWAAVLSMGGSKALSELSYSGLADNEVAREIGGLVLAAAWCGLTAVHAARLGWGKGE